MKLSKDTQALLERLPADGSWMKYWDWRDVREKGFSNRAHALCRRGLIDQKWDNDEGWMYRRAARAAKERT